MRRNPAPADAAVLFLLVLLRAALRGDEATLPSTASVLLLLLVAACFGFGFAFDFGFELLLSPEFA